MMILSRSASWVVDSVTNERVWISSTMSSTPLPASHAASVMCVTLVLEHALVLAHVQSENDRSCEW